MKIPGPFVVYMLHFAHPVEPLHYVGITTPARLDARMREHAAGRGSKTTAAACIAGLTWTLTATWHTEDRSLEKKIGGLRPLSGVCPYCRGQPPIRNYRPTKMAGATHTGHVFEGFNLQFQHREALTHGPMKKGNEPGSPPPSLTLGN